MNSVFLVKSQSSFPLPESKESFAEFSPMPRFLFACVCGGAGGVIRKPLGSVISLQRATFE